MLKMAKRASLDLAVEVEIRYWRLVFRLARSLGIWEMKLAPYRRYFWLPALAFPVGVVLGLASGG